MKTIYSKTQWEDNKTPINADRLNNIERGIENLYNNAIGASELIEGPGIDIANTDFGFRFMLNLKLVDEMPESSISAGNPGDYYIDSEGGYIYFCISSFKWIKIKLENFE